ncbi:MAG: RNA polymerase sigma-70 factor [Bacteroidales bacterium]|nr:RNA polymerase sigma-70 factor [Bacteroidales bacterium]
MAADEDKILFNLVKQGNKPAFDSLFHKYYVRLCRFVLSYTKSKDMAEETVQEVFVKIWCQRASLEIETSVVSYLFTAVKNHAFNELKKISIRKKYESEYTEKEVRELEKSPVIKQDDFKNALINAMTELPEKCREIFQLCKNDGLTYDEIAVYLNISPKTVDNQMGIAFKKLRELLKPVLEELLE